MGNDFVTSEMLNEAKNLTNSFRYKELLEQQDLQRREAVASRVTGCLILDEGDGFSSLTPNNCPVIDCEARFDKHRMRVANRSTCQILAVGNIIKPPHKLS